MGTSLFNTTPAATYPALLKVGDNTTLSATLKTLSDGSGNDSTLQLSTRRLGILQDTGVTTQTSSVIQATTTNANLVIAPNGTGALIADIPDGTATGGNARGNNVVDLQMNRAAATNVASANFSVISGGISNTASSQHSTVSGGELNTASTSTHATVVGGLSNVATGQYSIAGGNTSTASGTGSVALGQCTASGSVSVAMGNCSATGTRSTCIGFAIGASGQESVSLGGQGGTASGRGSFKMPGFGNNAATDYSISQGFAASYLYGQAAYSPNGLNGNQTLYSNLLMSKRDTLLSGGSTVLSLDGTGVTNLLIPGGQRWAWNVTVKTIAVVAQVIGTATGVTAGDCWLENETILFKRVIATSSIVNSASDNIMFDASMTTCSMAYTVGASGELKLTFTGPTFVGGGSVILHVASKIELTELQYT